MNQQEITEMFPATSSVLHDMPLDRSIWQKVNNLASSCSEATDMIEDAVNELVRELCVTHEQAAFILIETLLQRKL